MFIRSIKIPGPGGSHYEYLRLVESYRQDGKVKQRVVANLGRKDMLAPHLHTLVRLLQDEGEDQGLVHDDQVIPKTVSSMHKVLSTFGSKPLSFMLALRPGCFIW